MHRMRRGMILSKIVHRDLGVWKCFDVRSQYISLSEGV
jgi:hypothetical protein